MFYPFPISEYHAAGALAACMMLHQVALPSDRSKLVQAIVEASKESGLRSFSTDDVMRIIKPLI